jgi:hypothetical protein
LPFSLNFFSSFKFRAREFVSDSSGVTMDIGEEIRIDKLFFFNHSTTWLVEMMNITNIGSVALQNISIMWSAVPTFEASLRNLTGEERYYYSHSIPQQGSPSNAFVRSVSAGLFTNSGLMLGMIDNDARAWVRPFADWRAVFDSEAPDGGHSITHDRTSSIGFWRISRRVLNLALLHRCSDSMCRRSALDGSRWR